MMVAAKILVRIPLRGVLYLRNTRFLPSSLLELINAARHRDGDQYELNISPQISEEFRSAFTNQLAKVGFDANYGLTREGEILEELIDVFFVK